MGSLVITFGTTASPRTRTYSVADAHVLRAVPALKWHFGQVPDGNGGMRDMTTNEAMDAFSGGVRKAIIDIVKRYERDAATITAVNGVAEIVVSE